MSIEKGPIIGNQDVIKQISVNNNSVEQPSDIMESESCSSFLNDIPPQNPYTGIPDIEKWPDSYGYPEISGGLPRRKKEEGQPKFNIHEFRELLDRMFETAIQHGEPLTREDIWDFVGNVDSFRQHSNRWPVVMKQRSKRVRMDRYEFVKVFGLISRMYPDIALEKVESEEKVSEKDLDYWRRKVRLKQENDDSQL